ncbi:protein transporter Sec31 [Streptomyces sp. NPDC020794]|uniref:protein transporter Sec31 n=1 Tax=unclassified Streptomyces TaxID=2593676 RepID=UPI0036E284C6
MKTRTLTKYRWVPHTVDGDTELVREPYDVEVPVPPADWDQRVRTALTVGAVILIGVTVVWSTASIGDLLGRVTAPPAAYGAAVAFDLSWIMCQGAEWLFRYDPERARLPRRAGHFALLVAMGAVAAHGYLAGQLVIGGVGAAVSALAKGSSMVAMSVHARPLDPRTLQWVTRRRARYDAKMAMIPIKRDFQRAEGLVEAERRALATESGSGNPDADPEDSGERPQEPDPKVSELRPGALTTRDAVRTAWDSGIQDPDAVLRYVRTATGKDVPQDTVTRYLRALRVGA